MTTQGLQQSLKVLLINPPGKIYIFPDGSPAHRKHCTPPLGLAYLAACAREAGHRVKVVDMLAEGYRKETIEGSFLIYGFDFSDIQDAIRDFDPDVIGISSLFSPAYPEVVKLVTRIREHFPAVRIVLGGQHPTGAPEEVMNDSDVDFILLGEADITFPQLLEHIAGVRKVGAVRALYYREGQTIRNTMEHIVPVVKGDGWNYFSRKDSAVPLDLDSLPLPAWDLFDMTCYWQADVRYGGGDVARDRFVVMATTRGCPHACTFCTSPLQSGYKAYRKRSIPKIMEEIAWLKNTYGIEEIHFVDDNFNVGKAHARELMRELKEKVSNTLFTATGGTEVNAVDAEIVDLMADAGFYKVQLAIEAGTEDIQSEHVDKKVKLGRIPEVIAMFRRRNIEVRGLFMIGFPRETRSQIQKTLDLALSLDLDDFYISLVTPLPGTPLFDECVEQGLFTDNFDTTMLRYSFASIKLPDTSPEELETIRRTVWRARFLEKNKSETSQNARTFSNVAEYENAGIRTKLS